MVVLLTPGQQHESTMFMPLMEGGAVQRAGRGRAKQRPRRVVGDKGYSYPHIRRHLRRRGIRCTIPRRKDQHRGGPFDKVIYKTRNVVERMIHRLKHYRRLATRYDKHADTFRTLWVIGFIIMWASC
jgi:transposase